MFANINFSEPGPPANPQGGMSCASIGGVPTNQCQDTPFQQPISVLTQMSSPGACDGINCSQIFNSANDLIDLATLYTGAGVTVVVAAPVAVEASIPGTPAEAKLICLFGNIGKAWVATGTEIFIGSKLGVPERVEELSSNASFVAGTGWAVASCFVH